MYYQQGDVIIEYYDGEIEGKKAEQLVLAEGEVTGHAHRVVNGLAELFETGSTKYLIVKEQVKVSHEEHNERKKIKARLDARCDASVRLSDILTKEEQKYYVNVLKINVRDIAKEIIQIIPEELILPIGKYHIRKVLEYDHFSEEAREVQD